jgi:flagellar basal body-associated protein FliL
MKRGLLWTLIFSALVLVALVGAVAQAVHGSKPLLVAGA